jgi:putative transposase
MIFWEKQHFTMSSFRNEYTALLLVIARSTDHELARQVSCLKSENQILRSRLADKIIQIQRAKCRLVRFATNLGTTALNEIANIFHPGNICCWFRGVAKPSRFLV